MVIGVLQVIFQGTASNMDQLQDLLVFEVESFVVLKCGVTGSTSELLYPGIGWLLCPNFVMNWMASSFWYS